MTEIGKPARTPARNRRPLRWLAVVLLAVGSLGSPVQALDEVILISGRRYFGTIISSTPESIVLSIDGGTVEFPRAIIASPPYLGPVEAAPPPPPDAARTPSTTNVAPATHPLPGLEGALGRLATFPWGSTVRQVPVLVTDQGRWQFMPCISFWAGEFCQINFFGDPARPAAIEVSLHRPPSGAWEQKRRVLEYMLSLVPGLAVDNRFDALDVKGDSFGVGDLWFEVTGPDSTKSPGRWVVLLLHEPSLATARASYDEIEAVSELIPAATLDPTRPRSWQRGSWTPDELAWVRQIPGAPIAENVGQSDANGGVRPAAWTALGGERIFVRAFSRERGRYARTTTDWLASVTPRGN